MADTLLHEMRDEDGGLDNWVSSHQPFHWVVEFPSVWRQGGFDVIIGNPPYIKTSSVTGYRWIGYETQSCPDLYAVCMERASNLLNDSGRFAMIVMHSLCFSRHFVGSTRMHDVSIRLPVGVFIQPRFRQSVFWLGKGPQLHSNWEPYWTTRSFRHAMPSLVSGSTQPSWDVGF